MKKFEIILFFIAYYCATYLFPFKQIFLTSDNEQTSDRHFEFSQNQNVAEFPGKYY